MNALFLLKGVVNLERGHWLKSGFVLYIGFIRYLELLVIDQYFKRLFDRLFGYRVRSQPLIDSF